MKFEHMATKIEQLEKALLVVVQKTNQDRELDKRQREEERKQMLQMLEEEREKDRKHIQQMFEKKHEEDIKRLEQMFEEKVNSQIEKRDNLLMTTIRESQQTTKEAAASIEHLANYQEQMNKKPQSLLQRFVQNIFGSSK